MLTLRHLAQTLTESAGKEHLFLPAILAEIQVISEKNETIRAFRWCCFEKPTFWYTIQQVLAMLGKYGRNMALMCN